MDELSVLLALEQLRSNPSYHAAEVLRRNTSGNARAMASAAAGSSEHRAVLLLVSTWEVIAVLISGAKKKDSIFEVTPICHMYDELKEAIAVLGRDVPGYGGNFAKLNTDYQKWLNNKKGKAYRTAACNGLFAKFG